MRCLHVGKRHHQYLGRKLSHHFAAHEKRQLVAGGGAATAHKAGNGGLDGASHARIEPVCGVEDVPPQAFVVAAFHRAFELRFDLASVRHVGGAPLA